MSNVAVPSHPRQPQTQETEPNIMHQLRQRRAVALAPTVRTVYGGFRVSSSTRPIEYLVTQPNGHKVCTCADYTRHVEDPAFRCKHICAVELAQDMGFVSSSLPALPSAPSAPSSPAELAVLHRHLAGEDPVRLKLIKNTKGYSWEISVAEKDPQTALSVIQDLEQRVKAAFGSAEE
ncbi:MAG: hypothetical protein IT369_20530 [Candidatus Latescibacteria bacterium]|nr:hypothetical protein [Candidatus Latescibacterota bacterium]